MATVQLPWALHTTLGDELYTLTTYKKITDVVRGIIMTLKVFVDDNFQYRDESERYQEGESFEAAVAACKAICQQR